jgi:hypothetical protein
MEAGVVAKFRDFKNDQRGLKRHLKCSLFEVDIDENQSDIVAYLRSIEAPD